MAKRKPPKRRCKGRTKRGTRCKAPPPKGFHYCRAHDPQVPASARFGSPEQAARAAAGVERRVPRLTEILTQRVEDEADRIIGVLFDGLEASRGVVIRIGRGEDELVAVPDHGTRIVAARELMDRAVGRAKQVTEVSGDADRPVHVTAELFADPKTREVLHDLVRRAGAARAGGTGGRGAGD